jgi:hypothetical protein
MSPMKPFQATIQTLLAMLLGLLLAAPALAQTLNDTVRRVERETGGRILSAETVTSGSREVYRIKVLTPDGRVRVVQEPAPASRVAAPPRSRETPRRDVVPERSERSERQQSSREPPAFAPRERGYVPRREPSREAPPAQRGEREPAAAARERRGGRERRDE